MEYRTSSEGLNQVMNRQVRTAVLVGTISGLTLLGWTAAQRRWWPRAKAERTALAYAAAVYRQDTAALEQLTASGSAHNSLCAGRWSLGPGWGINARPVVVRRVGWPDTLEYHIGNDTGPTGKPLTFVFRIALAHPEKVLGYNVPSLADSMTALAFYTCIGWPEWPRVRAPLSNGH